MKGIFRFIGDVGAWWKGNNIDEATASTQYRWVMNRMIILLVITDVIVLLFTKWRCYDLLLPYFLTAHAYLIGGMLIGFIFGIPRKVAMKTANGEDGDGPYKDNTNLEEISDWLTKIIVGLTLVQFGKAISYINNAADKIATGLSCKECFCGYQTALVIAYATIFLFSGMGLICGYLWTRIKLPLILKHTRDKVKETNSAANMSKPEVLNKNLNAIETAEIKSTLADVLKDTPNLSAATNDRINLTVEQATIDSNEFLKRVETVKDARPVLFKDDLQRGRWGGAKTNKQLSISATVTKIGFSLYDITLSVTSQNGDNRGPVAFLLHDSFPKQVVIVPMINGVAKLDHLTAYEAFVVGAIAYDNNSMTELELDLNKEAGYPKGFYY